MVRETRHLWIGNLPPNIREERIHEHFKRYGRVQSIKILSPLVRKSSSEAPQIESASVAFVDIKSACKANHDQHILEDSVLQTEFYDPSSHGGIDSPRSVDGGSSRIVAHTGASRAIDHHGRSENGISNVECRSSHNGGTGGGSGTGSIISGSYLPSSACLRGGSLNSHDEAAFSPSRTSRSSSRSNRSRNTPAQTNYSIRNSGSSRHQNESHVSMLSGANGSGNVYGGMRSSSTSVSSLAHWNKDSSSSSAVNQISLNHHSSTPYYNNRHRQQHKTHLNSVSSPHNRHHRAVFHSRTPGSTLMSSSSSSVSCKRDEILGCNGTSTRKKKVKKVRKKGGNGKTSKSLRKSANSSFSSSSLSCSNTSASDSSDSSKSSSPSSTSNSSTNSSRSPSPVGPRNKTHLAAANSENTTFYHDFGQCAIWLRNLPKRISDTALQDELFEEYKKVCGLSAREVRVGYLGEDKIRFVVVYFNQMIEVDKALEMHQRMKKGGGRSSSSISPSSIFSDVEAEIFLSEDLIDDKNICYFPSISEVDEFHPRANRTLCVSGLSRDSTVAQVKELFGEFGDILEVVLKKSNGNAIYRNIFAFVEYADVSSVCAAIRLWEIRGGDSIKVGFGRSPPTKCVWCKGLSDVITEKILHVEFGRFGKIQDILIDRSKGHALIYFDQTIRAQRSIIEMRGRWLKGKRLHTDYASHELRALFFENCKKSVTIRRDETGHDKSSWTKEVQCPTTKLSSKKVKEIVTSKHAENYMEHDSSINQKETELTLESNVDNPVFTGSRVGYDSPELRRFQVDRIGKIDSSKFQGASNSSVSFQRQNSSNSSSSEPLVVNLSPTPVLPSRFDEENNSLSHYKTHTTTVSPPCRYSSTGGDHEVQPIVDLRDSLNRNKQNRSLRHKRFFDTNSATESLKINHRRVTRNETLESICDKKRTERHEVVGDAKKNSVLATKIVDFDKSNIHKENLKPQRYDSISHIYSKTNGGNLLYSADSLPSDHDSNQDYVSDGTSRPGTPLCDEHPENIISDVPVRLPSHLRSVEPMSLPLPRFAHFGQSPNSTPIGPSYFSFPELSTKEHDVIKHKSSKISNVKSPKCEDSLDNDPEHRTESVNVPSSTWSPPLCNGEISHPFDPRLKLHHKSPADVGTSPTSPDHSPDDVFEEEEEISDSENTNNTTLVSKASMSLEERLKALDASYEKWSGSTKYVSCSNSTGQKQTKFNFDIKPAQQSPIVQRLLARKSVFDEDSKRLESINEKYDPQVEVQNESGDVMRTSTPAVGGELSSIQVDSDFAAKFVSVLDRGLDTTNVIPTFYNTTSAINQPNTFCTETTNIDEKSSLPSILKMSSNVKSLLSSTETNSHLNLVENANLRHLPPCNFAGLMYDKDKVVTVSPTTMSSSKNNNAALVQKTQKVGEVKPIIPSSLPVFGNPIFPIKAAPLPNKVGSSMTYTPIKPLVDNKSRHMIPAKPSATVTPTMKSTADNKSLVRSVTLTNNSEVGSNIVEKEEASSTTCCPKTSGPVDSIYVAEMASSGILNPTIVNTVSAAIPSNKKLLSIGSITTAVGPVVTSPVSSTHPADSSCVHLDPINVKGLEEEIGGSVVSSTTSNEFKEVTIKKEPIDSSPDLVVKAAEVKALNQDVKTVGIKEHHRGHREHHRHHNRHHHRHSSSRHKSEKRSKCAEKRLKEKQDIELKNFLIASDDFIVKKDLKHEACTDANTDRLKKESAIGYQSVATSSNKQKRRLSDVIDTSVQKPKICKLSNKPITEQAKTKQNTTLNQHKNDSSKKIKQKGGSSNAAILNINSKDSIGKSYKNLRGHSVEDSKRSKNKLEFGSQQQGQSSITSGNDENSSQKWQQMAVGINHKRRQKHHHVPSDEDKKKKKCTKKDIFVHSMIDSDHERSVNPSKNSITKKNSIVTESDSSSDDYDETNKKFSIFDEPVFDINNPVYFSMYDKVKARRSCVKDRVAEQRKQQEELLKKFSKLKKERAKKEKAAIVFNAQADSDSSDYEDPDSGEENKAVNKSSVKKSKHLISSSEEDEAKESLICDKTESSTEEFLQQRDSKESDKKCAIKNGQTESKIRKHKSYKNCRNREKEANKHTSNMDISNVSSGDSKNSTNFPALANKKLKKKAPAANSKCNKVVSDISSDSDFEPPGNKAAATAVLLKKAKKVLSSAAPGKLIPKLTDGESEFEKLLLGSSNSDSEVPLQGKNGKKSISPVLRDQKISSFDQSKGLKTLKAKSGTCFDELSEQKIKTDREKAELDKQMSKIFGSSSSSDDNNDAEDDISEPVEDETFLTPFSPPPKLSPPPTINTFSLPLSPPPIEDNSFETQDKTSYLSSPMSAASSHQVKSKDVQRGIISSDMELALSSSISGDTTQECLKMAYSNNEADDPACNLKILAQVDSDVKTKPMCSIAQTQVTGHDNVDSLKTISDSDEICADITINSDKSDDMTERSYGLVSNSMDTKCMTQLEKSIASITDETEEDLLMDTNEASNLSEENESVQDPSKRSISQEETDLAVTALLGDSFDHDDDDFSATAAEENTVHLNESDVRTTDSRIIDAVSAITCIEDESISTPETSYVTRVSVVTESVSPMNLDENESPKIKLDCEKHSDAIDNLSEKLQDCNNKPVSSFIENKELNLESVSENTQCVDEIVSENKETVKQCDAEVPDTIKEISDLSKSTRVQTFVTGRIKKVSTQSSEQISFKNGVDGDLRHSSIYDWPEAEEEDDIIDVKVLSTKSSDIQSHSTQVDTEDKCNLSTNNSSIQKSKLHIPSSYTIKSVEDQNTEKRTSPLSNVMDVSDSTAPLAKTTVSDESSVKCNLTSTDDNVLPPSQEMIVLTNVKPTPEVSIKMKNDQNDQVALIDPETGHMLPMRHSDEGKYVPMAGHTTTGSTSNYSQVGVPQPTVLHQRQTGSPVNSVNSSLKQTQPQLFLKVSNPSPPITTCNVRSILPSSLLHPQLALRPRTANSTTSMISITKPLALPVQLPTQPIPHSEIRKPKQVLLEQQSNITSTSIFLPTQPIPMSSSALTSVKVVAPLLPTQPLLPNKPLPMSSVASRNAAVVIASPIFQQSGVRLAKGTSSIVSAVAAANLPRHPLPMQQQSTSSLKLNHVTRLQDSRPKSPANHSENKEARHNTPGFNLLPTTEAISTKEASSVAEKTLGAGSSIFPNLNMTPDAQRVHYMRMQDSTINQDFNILYHSLLTKGHPEHVARSLSNQALRDRYKMVPKFAPSAGSYVPLAGQSPSAMRSSIDNAISPQPTPPAAHSTLDTYRQSHSPLLPAHAHSRIPSANPYMHQVSHPDPYRPASSSPASVDHSEESPLQPPVAHSQSKPQDPTLPSPTTPIPMQPTAEFTLSDLEGYPIVWQGYMGLKNDVATVQFHYVSGCKELARASLPHSTSTDSDLPTLRIGQRMRLEPSQLDGVHRKMTMPQDHCVLIALPCGKDSRDVELQSRQLRSHFVTYLQLKGAAGIINVAATNSGLDQAAYIVHVFPSCDFANQTMSDIAPELLERVADIEHMVIIIATVFDNK